MLLKGRKKDLMNSRRSRHREKNDPLSGISREHQREIFNEFIDLSLELNLPLNVHSRSAGRYAIDMLLLIRVAVLAA